MISVDDECIIPVGEPDGALSTGLRDIITLLSLLMGHSCTPYTMTSMCLASVAFFIDVPESNSDSCFRGHAFVTNKDIVTQPSHALRHAAELTHLVRVHFSEDNILQSNLLL